MRHPGWWLLALNLFDAWGTGRGLASGLIAEGNPLLAWLLLHFPPLAWLVKLVGVPLLVWFVSAAPAGKWVQRALWLLVGVYSLVSLLHLMRLTILGV